ncbi:MAG: YkgJ family cysteine cluster protein [Candidatus Eremiobacteraeota bacterium]|nr:YkgJ family cysteine cluster protein [Candidatus Eremiobacteraeota bacterium]
MFIYPSDVQYTCVQCGKSCEHWRVWVDGEEARGKSWELEQDGPRLRLAQDDRGRCLELTEQNLCRLHPDKPSVCRQFPFLLVETPDGVQVGVSFRCTAVFQGKGVDWAEHEPGLRELLERGVPRVGFEPVALGHYQLDWQTYKGWEAFWLERLPYDLCDAVASTMGAALGLHPQSLERLVLMLTSSAIGFLESYNNEGAAVVAAAVAAEKEYKSSRRGWTAPIRRAFVGEMSEQAIRYLSHVIERKNVWLGSSFLGRVLMLLTAQRMLLYYTRLEGFALAVDRLEGEWLLHRQGLDDLEQTFEDTLLQLV